MNGIVRYAHIDVANLKFSKLDLESIRGVGYSDAAFSNNRDQKFQLECIIFLMDHKDSAAPIVFKSCKSRRVVRSVLLAEIITFVDVFDDAYAFISLLEKEMRRPVLMHLLTDFKPLFDDKQMNTHEGEKNYVGHPFSKTVL